MENSKDKNNGRKKTTSNKKSTIKMFLFMIAFTVVCVSVTIFLILKSHGTTDIKDIKKIIDGTIGKNEIATDDTGVKSLDETYSENPLQLKRVIAEDGTDYNDDAQFYYTQIEGLKNKDVENKINKKIQEIYKEERAKIDNSNEYKYLYISCTANFANVISFGVYGSPVKKENEDLRNGISFNLVNGEELQFEEMFTNDASIKNILYQSAYNSFVERMGNYREEDVVFTKEELEEQEKANKEAEEYGDPLLVEEIGTSDAEEYAFKFVNYYNSGKKFQFYFTSRAVYATWDGYKIKYDDGDEYTYNSVEIPMNRFYNQIAIYNRYKNYTDLYENEDLETGFIKNSSIPLFTPSADMLITPDIKTREFMELTGPIDYLNVFKFDNTIVIVKLTSYNGKALDKNLSSIKQVINKEIENYKSYNDDNVRCVEINMYYDDESKYGENGGKSTFSYSKAEYSTDKKNKEKFYKIIMESLQDGGYKCPIRLDTYEDDSECEYEGMRVKYLFDESYDEKNKYIYDEEKELWTNINDTRNDKYSKDNKKYKVIYIDPGHQKNANSEKEPVGPGASEMKAKSTPGEVGVVTGQQEYELNLIIAKKLGDELERKGYKVHYTRYSNNDDISNSERAKMANNDTSTTAFIRIHTNSSTSSEVTGVDTICQTEENEYNGALASISYELSKAIVDNVARSTGAKNNGVKRMDHTSGIDWCMVPTTIIEMGYLSNPEEDSLLATEEYQNKIVEGIVNGIEQYVNN